MERLLTFTLVLLIVTGCEKDPEKEPTISDQEFLQTHIFNGSSKWTVTRMEADTEREFNSESTTIWSDQFSTCRKDNIYSFGNLPIEVASIDVDESNSSCDMEEPDYVPQGLFLQFSSDYKKAAVSIRGAAMAKLFDLPYDSRIKLNGFEHSWEFQEVSSEKVVVKVSMPAGQSAGMVKNAAVVWVTFERDR